MNIKSLIAFLFLATVILLSSCRNEDKIEMKNIEKAKRLIEALETGDSKALRYISDDMYIQHNLSFASGKEAIAPLFSDSPTGFTTTTHRVFGDDDIVVMHNSYSGTWNNGVPQVAFDVFRFERGKIVEHWDNLQDEVPASETESGRSMVDGPTVASDLDNTAANQELVTDFVNTVLVGGDASNITDYVSTTEYAQHNPGVADGLDGLGAALEYFATNGLLLQYDKLHYVYAEGNFVLTISEGLFLDNQYVAYYDLFRVDNGKIVEHWDVIQNIPPEAEWQNSNGKF